MREHFTKLSNKQKALKAQTPIYPADIQTKQMTLMYTRSSLTNIVYLIPVHASSHNIQRENLLQQKRQNLNVVFVTTQRWQVPCRGPEVQPLLQIQSLCQCV